MYGSSFCLDIGSLDPPEVLIDGLPEVSSNGDQIFIPQEYAFYQIRKLTMGATVASMVAYLQLNLLMYIFFIFKSQNKWKKTLVKKQCLYPI